MWVLRIPQWFLNQTWETGWTSPEGKLFYWPGNGQGEGCFTSLCAVWMLYNFCVHDFYYLPPTNTRQIADMPFNVRWPISLPFFSYRILSKHLYALTCVALKASSHCKSSYFCFIDEEAGEAQRFWRTCLGLEGYGGSPSLWAHQDSSWST